MDQSQVWGLPRHVALVIVLALHAAVLAVLLMAPGPRYTFLSMDDPVELLYLPPPPVPKIRPENSHPQRLSGDTAIWVAPLVLGAASPSPASPSSASPGNGLGVDWKAEARRAVQAFEIRRREPSTDSSLSGSPAEEHWWPRAYHHAGEQYKTVTGDWIVWINASCYQIASSAANAAIGVLLPQTVCPGESSTARGDLFDKTTAYQKVRPKE